MFGRRLAIISTTLLAVLPIDVAYSRIAWDASQSLLATLPCVYLPLWAIVNPRLKARLSIATAVALLIAIMVHPTNLFIAPLAIVCLAFAWRATFTPRIRPVAAGGAVLIGLSVVATLYAAVRWFPESVARIANPQQYTAFLASFGRLFSGATVYEYFSGAVRPAASAAVDGNSLRWDCVPYDAAAWIIGGWLTWGFVRELRRKRPELIYLSAGWAVSLFGFFLVAGPGGLAPNFERYALWTIAPAAAAASIAIEGWQRRCGRWAVFSTAAALALGWLMLFGFQTNCLDFMRQTGGRSHRTFRTSAVEPKQAAMAAILAQREPEQAVRIVTSEWWIYWPMRYLSFGIQSKDGLSPVSVELRTIEEEQTVLSEFATAHDGRVWFVEFTATRACDTLRNTARAIQQSLRETRINDFAGQPILSLFTRAGRTAPKQNHTSQKKIKELGLTSRVSELSFLGRSDDQRDLATDTAFGSW